MVSWNLASSSCCFVVGNGRPPARLYHVAIVLIGATVNHGASLSMVKGRVANPCGGGHSHGGRRGGQGSASMAHLGRVKAGGISICFC